MIGNVVDKVRNILEELSTVKIDDTFEHGDCEDNPSLA